jgi:hypothetical protein
MAENKLAETAEMILASAAQNTLAEMAEMEKPPEHQGTRAVSPSRQQRTTALEVATRADQNLTRTETTMTPY